MAGYGSRSLRSKKTTIKKKPSEVSMLSAVTKASNGSSGSNSTVTQESVTRKTRSSKQDAPRKVASTRPSHRKSSSRTANTLPRLEEKPDVFQFLEQDEDEEAEDTKTAELEGVSLTQASLEAASVASSSSSSSSSSREHDYSFKQQSPTSFQNYRNDRQQAWDNATNPPGAFHSDSGISVRSSSPEPESPVLSHPNIYGKGKGKEGSVPVGIATSRVLNSRVSRPFDGSPDMSPEAFYSISSRPNMKHTEYGSSSSNLPCHQNLEGSEDDDEEVQPTDEFAKSAHDLLASIVSSDKAVALKPMYRKFERLNNRVLLLLQGELMELEANLEKLDKAIGGVGNETADNPAPQDGSSVSQEWQRRELVGRISVKLDQYNRALSSFSSVSRHLDLVSSAEVAAYREWLEDYPLPDDVKVAFTNYEQDLLTVPGRSSLGPSERTALATGSALLMTMIALKAIPQLISRLLVGFTISFAMLYTQMSTVTLDAKGLHECAKRAAIYATAVVILAVAVG